MPMFDLEKADKVRLRDVDTTAESMLKAQSVGELDAERCSAGTAAVVLAPTSKWTSFKKFCTARIVEISVGVIVVVIGAVLTVIYVPTLISYLT